MNDLTLITMGLIRERARQQDSDVQGYEMPVTNLLDYAERLEAENRRLLRGLEAISTFGGGEARRLARLVLEGADTHAWRLGGQQHGEGEGRPTWTAGN
jgi:hypothetical protein